MRLPLWFRAFVVASFAFAFLVFFLVRDGSLADAVARSAYDRLLAQGRPLVDLVSRRSARSLEPEKGSYRINGLRVDFSTVPAPGRLEDLLDGFEHAFVQAGYVAKRVEVDGGTLLVGVHPGTLMMLTVSPRQSGRGKRVLRLTQTDLGRIDESFVAEIPGIPMLADATGAVLVSQVGGPKASSLQYATSSSPEWIAQYYETEMALAGWESVPPPAAPSGGELATLFFTRRGEECAVVAMRSPDEPGSVVLVTVSDRV